MLPFRRSDKRLPINFLNFQTMETLFTLIPLIILGVVVGFILAGLTKRGWLMLITAIACFPLFVFLWFFGFFDKKENPDS
ncbi:MAG: hypothetical protein OXU98_05985 [Gammaproteobacteria bacterium]|nr:hypothetical protein [Gammaproteobacteria bacterium]